MATFKYRAKKGSEGIVEGKIEAQTEKDAVEKLSQIGYLPIQIDEDKDSVLSPEQYAVKPPGKIGRIKSRHITIFSRELASLIKSGVPILKALSIISEQSESPNLKEALRNIYNAVKHGATFSSCLSQYPRVFSSIYVAMVQAGENSGALPEALLRIADYRTKEEEMISRFRMALVYPVLMAIVGLATVVFMLTFVIPRLTNIFTNMGQTLPVPTQILISASNAVRESWHWIILILVAAIFVLKQQLKTRAGKISLSLFKLHIPVFGKFILKAELSRFSRTLELLIKNGIPILKALSISIPVLENEIIKNKLRQSYKELEQGGSLGRSLKGSNLVPIFMSNLITVGEESGRLEEALGEVARNYENDVDEAVRIMGNLLEPVIILLMGLVVGFIVISMLLPIFQINL